ncbi:hypothetical protein B0J15DRAFT_475235 [Fusarium solani]|uniref:Secreted protein n=1 Tax=Fusarium solani TaxID=169388 RepID=A0A9P9L647_FUSSL|nr:uncharacterized protein B0J15DRAFT_475235 [Fusarium solani]KAH7275535.1 hypothetical protein B0J15DRAFT_475235 [Fusarium solani]
MAPAKLTLILIFTAFNCTSSLLKRRHVPPHARPRQKKKSRYQGPLNGPRAPQFIPQNCRPRSWIYEIWSGDEPPKTHLKIPP